MKIRKQPSLSRAIALDIDHDAEAALAARATRREAARSSDTTGLRSALESVLPVLTADEAEALGACMSALATAEGLSPDAYEGERLELLDLVQEVLGLVREREPRLDAHLLVGLLRLVQTTRGDEPCALTAFLRPEGTTLQ